MPPPTTLLSLPLELRLKIYDLVLSSSSIHSFRPQRKIGWNRPHADLSNPAQLFESDAHPVLRQLFHSKLTKGDHAAILIALLTHPRIKVLCATFEDFAALQKLSSATVLPSAAVSLSPQARSLASVVKEHLRSIDFSDKLDEIVCQPSDLTKLLMSLPGLKTITLTSKHIQRYSGTIEEHLEFAQERAQRQDARSIAVTEAATTDNAVDEFRRLRLRSPMTDGTRMLVSPSLWSGSNTPRSTTPSGSTTSAWVVVDLSLLVWQHFLYTGAPYRDHWRCVKMQTLLSEADKLDVNVVLNFRNIEFDPISALHRPASSQTSQPTRRTFDPKSWAVSGTFRGEMSTVDWILRLRHRNCGAEYAVRQRRRFDELVKQDEIPITRCVHQRRKESLCTDCAKEVKV